MPSGVGDWWKWVASTAIAVIIFMIGGFVGDRYSWAEIERHRNEGHPVTQEKLEALTLRHNRDMIRMEAILLRIEDKAIRIEEKVDANARRP